MTKALFLPDGDTYVATELTRGPWDPDAHGGSPSALLAREATRYANGGLRVPVVAGALEQTRS